MPRMIVGGKVGFLILLDTPRICINSSFFVCFDGHHKTMYRSPKRTKILLCKYYILDAFILIFSYKIPHNFAEKKDAAVGATNNFRKTSVTPTNYISSERRFIGESKSFKTLEKIF